MGKYYGFYSEFHALPSSAQIVKIKIRPSYSDCKSGKFFETQFILPYIMQHGTFVIIVPVPFRYSSYDFYVVYWKEGTIETRKLL